MILGNTPWNPPPLHIWEVFALQGWSSCHCGPQGAVVHSRVRRLSRGEFQKHTLFLFVYGGSQARNFLWRGTSLTYVVEELWDRVGILPIPLQILNITITVVTGESDIFSLNNDNWRMRWCYCIPNRLSCKVMEKRVQFYNFCYFTDILQSVNTIHFTDFPLEKEQPTDVKSVFYEM